MQISTKISKKESKQKQTFMQIYAFLSTFTMHPQAPEALPVGAINER